VEILDVQSQHHITGPCGQGDSLRSMDHNLWRTSKNALLSNDAFNRFGVDLEMSDPTLSDIDFKNKMDWV